MKKPKQFHKSIFLFFLWHSGIAMAQEIYPAGVSEPYLWIKAETKYNQTQITEVRKNKNLEHLLSPAHLINENPSFKLSLSNDKSNNGLNENLSLSQAENYSLFIVYKDNTQHQHSSNSVEENLWTLSDAQSSSPIISATTHRLANLAEHQYRSFSEYFRNQKVKIHYYQHSKSLSKRAIEKQKSQGENPTPKDSYTFNIGGKTAELPPHLFSGNFAEILIYDRVLSPLEMQRIASYLAIKYGISLEQTEFKNYYNSKGQKIWDFEENKAFNQNITAIGKDSEGSLLQIKSQNSNDEGILSLGLKKTENLQDQTFIFWSDNGQSLEIKKQKEGQPNGVSRQWKLQYAPINSSSTHSSASPEVFSIFDTHKIIHQKNKQKENSQFYWLAIDDSGTGDFSAEETRYIKLGDASATPSSQPVSFEDWNLKSNKPLIFSIWQAPKMFAHLSLEPSKCISSDLGKMKFNLIGGKAPYHIHLINTEKPSFQKQWTELKNKGEKETLLASGKYQYTITDAEKNSYSNEVYLTDEDAPNPQLNTEYLIKKPLLLSPQKDLPKGNYFYEWYHNGNLISQNPEFLLSQAGDYELRLTNEFGCHSVNYFTAYTHSDTTDSPILLYPNPSTDGHFTLLAQFPKRTSGSVSIYTMSGQIVYSKDFYNESQYQYSGYLPTAGVYIIKLKTTYQEISKKLIIN